MDAGLCSSHNMLHNFFLKIGLLLTDSQEIATVCDFLIMFDSPFRKCAQNAKFWKSALCGETKNTNISMITLMGYTPAFPTENQG